MTEQKCYAVNLHTLKPCVRPPGHSDMHMTNDGVDFSDPVAASPDPFRDSKHREHYRSGYSAGWSDGRNGQPMEDERKAAMFFGPELHAPCSGLGCEACKGTGEKPIPVAASAAPQLAENAPIELNGEYPLYGRIGVGPDVWAELVHGEQVAATRTQVFIGYKTFQTVMNALRHCGLKHYNTPSERASAPPIACIVCDQVRPAGRVVVSLKHGCEHLICQVCLVACGQEPARDIEQKVESLKAGGFSVIEEAASAVPQPEPETTKRAAPVSVCRHCGADLKFIDSRWIDRETHTTCDIEDDRPRAHEPLLIEQAQDAGLVRDFTEIVRQADHDFQRVGGGSRHWVRECFLPALNRAGFTVQPLSAAPLVAQGAWEPIERANGGVLILGIDTREWPPAEGVQDSTGHWVFTATKQRPRPAPTHFQRLPPAPPRERKEPT